MPNIKSAAKAMRSSARKRVYNERNRSSVRKEVKAIQKLISAGKKDEAAAKMKDVIKALDKAVKKNVLKKNTASRKKSRFAKAIAKIK